MRRELASSHQSAPPDCLTVDEAAAVLRISRTKAYAQVNEYLDVGGEAGIPAIRIARQIRVPRAAKIAATDLPIPRRCSQASPRRHSQVGLGSGVQSARSASRRARIGRYSGSRARACRVRPLTPNHKMLCRVSPRPSHLSCRTHRQLTFDGAVRHPAGATTQRPLPAELSMCWRQAEICPSAAKAAFQLMGQSALDESATREFRECVEQDRC
jgi:hypothetical protein